MSEQVLLYDLPSKEPCAGWSPNPWKTRLVLNFKQIPYTTQWIEYPDLAPTFKGLGIPPNPPGSFADYTSPTVRLPDGTYCMESLKIAEALEAFQATPSLHLEDGYHQEVIDAITELGPATLGMYLHSIEQNVLREPSKSWFTADRFRRLGMTMEELEAKTMPVAYENGKPAFEKLKVALTSHKKDEGPFILGSTPSYGDLIVAALFEGLRRCRADQHEKMLSYDRSFGEVYEACKQWMKKDD